MAEQETYGTVAGETVGTVTSGETRGTVASGQTVGTIASGKTVGTTASGQTVGTVDSGETYGTIPRKYTPPPIEELEKILLVDGDGATLQWLRDNNKVPHWEHIKNGYSAPDINSLTAGLVGLKQEHSLANPPSENFNKGKSFKVGFWFQRTIGAPTLWYGVGVRIYNGGDYLTGITAVCPKYLQTNWGVILACAGTFDLSIEDCNALTIEIESVGVGWTPGSCTIALDEIDVRLTCDYDT